MTDLPPWFSRIDISACKEHFEEVERFADASGRKEQFLNRLKRLVGGDQGESVHDAATATAKPGGPLPRGPLDLGCRRVTMGP